MIRGSVAEKAGGDGPEPMLKSRELEQPKEIRAGRRVFFDPSQVA
jgi:hypothetical protein